MSDTINKLYAPLHWLDKIFLFFGAYGQLQKQTITTTTTIATTKVYRKT